MCLRYILFYFRRLGTYSESLLSVSLLSFRLLCGHALNQALLGTDYGHFKVVEGRSNRKYVSDADVASAVQKAGYDPYEKKLLGITAMTSLLGKKKFEELLSSFTYKPPGKPTLVSKADKRPPMKNTAENDFKE